MLGDFYVSADENSSINIFLLTDLFWLEILLRYVPESPINFES